jgi:AcrR family transcriptional regulator
MEVRPTKTRLSAQERRLSIIEAAVKLFADKGFRGTTTRELASAVGVSEPVLYEHFPSKRELFAAILESKSADGLERLRALAAESLATDDDHRFLIGVARMILDYHVRERDLVLLIVRATLEDPAVVAIEQKMHCSFMAIIEGYFQERISEGAFRAVCPQRLARTFTSQWMWVGMDMLKGCASVPDPFAEVEPMVDIFLRGIVNVAADTQANDAPNKTAVVQTQEIAHV